MARLDRLQGRDLRLDSLSRDRAGRSAGILTTGWSPVGQLSVIHGINFEAVYHDFFVVGSQDCSDRRNA